MASQSFDRSASQLAACLYEAGKWAGDGAFAARAARVRAAIEGTVGECCEYREYWRPLAPLSPHTPWLSYAATPRQEHTFTAGVQKFKVYLSFPPDTVCAFFGELLRLLSSTPCLSFKVAVAAEHVDRPDSFVAYAGSLGDLNSMVEGILSLGILSTPSGLLFAADTDSPNLFWAIDLIGVSWRRMVCGQVATALANSAGTMEQRLASVAERVRLLGICPQRWLPYAFLRAPRHE